MSCVPISISHFDVRENELRPHFDVFRNFYRGETEAHGGERVRFLVSVALGVSVAEFHSFDAYPANAVEKAAGVQPKSLMNFVASAVLSSWLMFT